MSVSAWLCAAGLFIPGTAVASPSRELRSGGTVAPLPLDSQEILQRWQVPQEGSSIYGLATDNQGNVIVAGKHNVRKYTRNGLLLSEWIPPDPGTADIWGIEIPASENVVVLDVGNGRVLTFSWEDGLLNYWALPESGRYRADLAVDEDGNVYVAARNRIRVYSPEGVHLRGWDVPYLVSVDTRASCNSAATDSSFGNGVQTQTRKVPTLTVRVRFLWTAVGSSTC
jgi:hypothetical protein